MMQADSPALQLIAAAKQQLKANAKKVQAYSDLTTAMLRRYRETADSRYLKEAEAAYAAGEKIDASDFQLQRAHVALLLSRHDYSAAKELATKLNHQLPDDVVTYGYLAEADIALGNYQEAEENAQWMMNLRPNNMPVLLIGATLRTLYGDTHGAIEFLNQAYSQTSPMEVEELAWIANRIASIQIESGEIEAAVQTLERAEQLFPNYPYSMENLARVRMAEGRAGDAVRLLSRASSLDDDPHNLYELAQAQEAAGATNESRATMARFEKLAKDSGIATDGSTIDLILLLAASTETAPEALARARQQMESQQDVWTLDAYAWSLYANGKFREANDAVRRAIAVGIQSARVFDHAGHIAEKLGYASDAGEYFALALRSEPHSEFALDAGREINLLAGANPRPAPALSAGGTANAAARKTEGDEGGNVELVSKDLTVMARAENVAHSFAPVPEALLVPMATGTEASIHRAQTAISKAPNDAKLYAGLGAAYFQRARETGDVNDYQLAEQALAKSIDLDATNFSAEIAFETLAEVCMGEHRFADALLYAHKALSLGSGELSPFAIIGDAYADMGEYEKAADAYSRLSPHDMTLSPRVAYARDSRLSYLKFIVGDNQGAIKLMKEAIVEGAEAQIPSENLAWLYYELGEFETQAGDSSAADSAYLAALDAHPGDYRAMAALAKLRANNGKYTDAIALYQRAIAVVPMPVFVAELGDVYEKTGKHAEAKKQYELVEYIGVLGHINQVLHNRDLAMFYADHDIKLSEALELAKKELEVRHDVYTWDALAWASYKSGKMDDAAKAIDFAMHFGTRDAMLQFHAGMISEALGQYEKASSELKEALQINPHFHPMYAEEAQKRIGALTAEATAKGGGDRYAR